MCAFIYEEVGIRLGAEKKTMLEGRIRRRLKALDLNSYGQYCDYLFDRRGHEQETVHLIDVVTTNKTDFFREPTHFDLLLEKVLPELTSGDGSLRPLLFWSAGCSTGEEPYTLAIVLSEYALNHPSFRFRILATDVSTTVLAKAEMGVYPSSTLDAVSPALKRRYFMRSREPGSERMRVVPELRRLVEFRRLNFMDADYGLAEKASAIFCRNVIIYFDRPTQERILSKLTRHLVPGGYFFSGHSEALHDLNLPLEQVAPALYRRTDA